MADPATDYFYQTVGFHFKVTFEGLPNGKDADIRFQSVTGLDVQFDTDTIKEGGENRFTHTIPGRTNYPSGLTLKRGLLLPGNSDLTDWFHKAFQQYSADKKPAFSPLKTVLVALLNEDHKVLVKWDLSWVWPKSWKIAEFNAERSEVLIETLELNYNRFEYKKP